jgi:tyrosyl-tRNA synthetase
MIMGLKEGQEKMSKSDPMSAIFMEDTAAEVKSKIKGAFCPPMVVDGNPCLDWIKHIVFPYFEERLGAAGWEIKRSEGNGGDKRFASFEDLAKDYVSGALHPGDVKSNLTDAINAMLEPVRKHFAGGEPAKLLAQIKAFQLQAAKKAAAAAPAPAPAPVPAPTSAPASGPSAP